MIIAAASEFAGNRRAGPSVIRLHGQNIRKRQRRALRSVSFLVLALIASRPAFAQNAQRDSTPETLFEPERGAGVQIAPGFRLYPSLEFDADYDSNVYNTDTAKQADAILRVQPRAIIASNFSRHYVELSAGAEFRRYADISNEDAEAYRVNGKTRLELGGHIDLDAEAGYAHLFEQRGTAGDQFLTDKPVEFDRTYLAARLSRFRARLGLALDGRITQLRYDDATVGGVPLLLDDRDVNLKQANFRISYRLREGLNLFGQTGLNEVDYRTPVASQRNSDGYSVLAGLQLQPSEALNFEVAAGFLNQDFDDPAFDRVKTFNYRLSADWTPRRTWKLRAEVKRDVDPSPRNDAPAIIRSEFKLGVQHSAGDRLLIEANGSSVQENYHGISRTDRFYRVGLSARYRINGNTGVKANLGYRTQSGGRDYNGFYAGAGLSVVF